ncbi:MFS transporter [Corallincola platygyrae]|uniref:MFS transporter n=1 Tax=Corallincola platygyrae TaxID=1193278 RepID=A0ABW4XRH1_9GAMM
MTPRHHLSFGSGYFAFFAILGLMVPYLSVFLDGRGYSSLQIGELLAILMATRIVSPNLWAYVADHTGKRVHVMRVGALLAFVCFFLAYPNRGIAWMALALASFSFFWAAILPQLEVLTLRSLGQERHHYSKIRAWGSIGFILVVVIAGYVIEARGAEQLLIIGSVLLGLLVVSTYLINDIAIPRDDSQSQTLAENWLSWPMAAFMVSTILLQISHGPYYGFFVLYMEQFGYSNAIAGWLITLGVVAEIGVFMVSGRLLERMGIKAVLAGALLLTAGRWALLAWFAHWLPTLLLAQVLHAASFGLTHAASIQFIHGYFSEKQQGRGQAMYNSIGFGVGGAIGAWIAGLTWQQGQGATTSFAIATIAALLAWALIMFIPTQRLAPTHK